MMFTSRELPSRIYRNLIAMVIMLYLGIETLLRRYFNAWMFLLGTLMLGLFLIEGRTYQSLVLSVFMMGFCIALLQRAYKMAQNRKYCCECGDCGANDSGDNLTQ